MVIEQNSELTTQSSLFLRAPTVRDGAGVYELLQRCSGLQLNSGQCYQLLCEHFHSTCVVAVQDDRVVAFISSYILPERHDTLFVWQIAVDDALRGRGIAKKMLRHLLSRRNLKRIRFVEAVLDFSNETASRLFQSLARECYCTMDAATTRDLGKEHMIRVGPISPVSKTLIGRG